MGKVKNGGWAREKMVDGQGKKRWMGKVKNGGCVMRRYFTDTLVDLY